MDPDRFDDVNYQIVETPDAPRGRRLSGRGAAATAAGVLAAGALFAGAALALTPASTPGPAAAPPPPVPAHFAAEHYPARGSQPHALHGGNCLHLHARERSSATPAL